MSILLLAVRAFAFFLTDRAYYSLFFKFHKVRSVSNLQRIVVLLYIVVTELQSAQIMLTSNEIVAGFKFLTMMTVILLIQIRLL
jgi:hypothetical protein